MNIQQLINTFGCFIDECATAYPKIIGNKDKILDRCFNLYDNCQGLYYSNAEIFGKGKPKPNFTNYFGVNSDDESACPRNFYAFVTLRYIVSGKTQEFNDVVKAIACAKEKVDEETVLYFYNGEERFFISDIIVTEEGCLKIGDNLVKDMSQLKGFLSICGVSTSSEDELKKQLRLLHLVFLKFNEQGV
ncbi:MAG: hypothetical protein J5521_11820 [Lachnospiraceae bacterium]|nr:hypothetical protein [Lachnospiraceae bacterium]